MVDKSKLSKDVEEQIQSLASDVYIQVEEKLTHLITTAVKAQLSQNTEQQSKDLSEKEQLLKKDLSDKEQSHAKEIAELKQALAEKKADEDTAKQSFQVELTQNTINYTETIESLEKELANLKKQNTQQQGEKQSSDNKLEEKLLETEQKLNDKTQEVDGLNGRIMVLTEQEQSLTQQLTKAKEQIESVSAKQASAINEVKQQVTDAKQEQITAIAEKLQAAEKQIEQAKAEALKDAEGQTVALNQKITELTAQIQQEQNGKAELQQQLSTMQKSIDTEQDKTKQFELQSQAHQAELTKLNEQDEKLKQAHKEKTEKLNQEHQAQIAQLNEQIASGKQQQLEEIKSIQAATVEANKLHEEAKLKIIELDKTNQELVKQVETEQNDIKLYQQEVSVLNEQVKVAQEGQENILQRFNSNRDKQEEENNKVRETIKFLRDENHQLTSESGELKAQYTDQINDLELKLTEYRLKFEYAQKQLAN